MLKNFLLIEVCVIKKVWRPLIYSNKTKDMGNPLTKQELYQFQYNYES